MALFAIKDIQANPFRHIARYPIKPQKVAALRESLRTTGFWGNVVARERAGKAEIAYGHHRLVALREEYGPSYKVDLIIRTLTDEVMLQMMARENMEEWGTTASVEHETIRAVVEAYAEGKIRLPAIPANIPDAQRRYAPSFVPGERRQPAGGAPYTAQAIAQFIGWLEPGGQAQTKVSDALNALQFVEEGLLKESDFEGLTTMQAHAVVEEARKARTRQETVTRLHRQQAEEAEREAKAAERRREQAEQEQRRREAQAAAARDAEKKRKALDEAKRSEREQREAEEARKRALQRQAKEREKERASVQKGRERATAVGRAVSTGIKSGEIGYKRASEVASRADVRKPAGPPPYIEDYARKLATELNMILDPERDARVARLLEIIKHRDYLNDRSRADLARTLEAVAARAVGYAKQLSGNTIPERRSLPSKR
jgi:hypothetical protein